MARPISKEEVELEHEVIECLLERDTERLKGVLARLLSLWASEETANGED